MIIKSLRNACIAYLIKKRVKMLANGSNCADIDKQLKENGYKS